MTRGRPGELSHGAHRLASTQYGEGPRVVVLLHGLLLDQRMHAQLADALADRGHRAVTLDLLGHGRSDRPRDMSRYSMPAFATQVASLRLAPERLTDEIAAFADGCRRPRSAGGRAATAS